MNPFGRGVTGLLGAAGVLILVLVLLHVSVRRTGGWALLRRRVKRELALIGRAWSEPAAAQLRYRRRLRFLTGELRSARAWSDAERAIGYAATIDEACEPYAVVVGKDRLGVLVAGGVVIEPLPGPWSRDLREPRLWWIPRRDLQEQVASPSIERTQPLLVCVGVDSTGRTAVLLDLLAGPDTLSVYGVPRTATAVVQAVAAQLEVRLPGGAVEVAEGIHSGHPGPSVAEAVKHAGVWFAVGAEPLETPVPEGVRLVSLGVGRGSSRLMEALLDGSLRLHGAPDWLELDPYPLAKAVARSVRRLPAYDFERQAAPAAFTGDDDLDSRSLDIGMAGVSVTSAGDAGADLKANSWT
jgi:hypothetical protein